MPAARNPLIFAAVALALASAVAAAPALRATRAARKPTTPKQPPAKPVAGSPEGASAREVEPMTLDEARMTVEMLDDAYQTVLQEVHHTYPTKPGRPVAATVVRDLQKTMTDKGWPKSHFLAVNAIIMNPDHKARDEFEVRAVKAIGRGDQRYESVENGQLRVATAVSLGGDCFSCHWTPPGRSSRAAISFAIPLKATAEGTAASRP